MVRTLIVLLVTVGVISLVGCATVDRTTDAIVKSGFFYYDPHAHIPYGYRDYRDVVGLHMWLENRTTVYKGPQLERHHSFDGACYRCH